MVELAHAQQFEELCQIGAGNCDDILEAAGGVPGDEPTIVQNEAMPGDDTGLVRLLSVCGSLPNGDQYHTEMAVTWQSGRLTVLEPIYWSGMSVGVTPDGPVATEGPSESADEPCPP